MEKLVGIAISLSLLLLVACGESNSTTTGVTAGNESSELQNGQPSVPSAGAKIVVACEAKRFFDYLNVYRRSLGLKPLGFSSKLFSPAQWHAEDMAINRYLDHTDSLGRGPSTRIAAFGYTIRNAFGENVAALSFTSAEKVFCGWKNSPGHHSNMISPNYVGIAVGFKTAPSDNATYWSTPFTGYSLIDDFKIPEAAGGHCSAISTLPNC